MTFLTVRSGKCAFRVLHAANTFVVKLTVLQIDPSSVRFLTLLAGQIVIFKATLV